MLIMRFRLIAPLGSTVTRIRVRNSAILRVKAQLRGLLRNIAAQSRAPFAVQGKSQLYTMYAGDVTFGPSCMVEHSVKFRVL